MAVANYVNCYLIGQNIREQLFLTSTKKKLNREIGYYLSFDKEKSFCSDAIAHKTYKCYMCVSKNMAFYMFRFKWRNQGNASHESSHLHYRSNHMCLLLHFFLHICALKIAACCCSWVITVPRCSVVCNCSLEKLERSEKSLALALHAHAADATCCAVIFKRLSFCADRSKHHLMLAGEAVKSGPTPCT